MTIGRLARVIAVLLCASCPAAYADGGCAATLQSSLRKVQLAVLSLRLEHPEQVQWMQEQLRLIDAACGRGGEVEATWRLEALQEFLKGRAARRRAA